MLADEVLKIAPGRDTGDTGAVSDVHRGQGTTSGPKLADHHVVCCRGQALRRLGGSRLPQRGQRPVDVMLGHTPRFGLYARPGDLPPVVGVALEPLPEDREAERLE